MRPKSEGRERGRPIDGGESAALTAWRPAPCSRLSLQRTAAPSHSNSNCSYSGLNDMIVGQGPTDFHVQSPGQDVRKGLTPPGVPGSKDPSTGRPTCGGGSNPENP